MTQAFDPPRKAHCACPPPQPQPLPLPMDRYPTEGSEATVTSDGVFRALQDLTQAYGEVLGELGELQTNHKNTIVGAINETFLRVLAVNARTQFISQILGAPLAFGPTWLWLGGNCVTGSHSVQVVVNPNGTPQLIIGSFNGTFTQYVLPNDWEEVLVRINGLDSLRFFQDPRLKKLDQAYILPATGVPYSDLSAEVRNMLVPSNGITGQVLTKLSGGAAAWQTLPAFLQGIEHSSTPSFYMLGDGTALNPLRGNVQLSSQAGNVLQTLVDGLFVPASTASITVGSSDDIALQGNGLVANPIRASVILDPDPTNQLQSSVNGLFVPEPALVAGPVRYDEVQSLTISEQAQARDNIGAASALYITALSNDIATAQSTANTAISHAATAQTTADGAVIAAGNAQTTANTAIANAATAQSTADSAVTELANKVSRRSGIGTFVYGYSGSTDIGIEVTTMYSGNNIPRYNAQGVLTTGIPVQDYDAAPKLYVDEQIQELAAHLYLGAFFFGRTTTTFVPPLPTTSNQNYFDFTSNSVYVARADLSGWDFDHTIDTPINSAFIRITSEFWDLSLDAGLPGTATWNANTMGWDFTPSRFESPPDGKLIILNGAGELTVGISPDPTNKLEGRLDGLYVNITDFGLPVAPTLEGPYVLNVDSTGAVTWSTSPITSLQTGVTNAQNAANAAQSTATTALTNAATAQGDATQALSDAATAQGDATQALSDAAAAQSTANSAVSGLANKVDKVTAATGEIRAYTVSGAVQGSLIVSGTIAGNTLAQRTANGQLLVNDPVNNTDAVNLQFLNGNIGTINTAISAVDSKATNALSEAGLAQTAAAAAQSAASSAVAALANKVDKISEPGLHLYLADNGDQTSVLMSQNPDEYTVVQRDFDGRIKVGEAGQPEHAVNLQQVSEIASMLVSSHQDVHPTGSFVYTIVGGYDTVSPMDASAATANSIAQRTSTGALVVANATAANHAVTKSQLDAVAVLESTLSNLGTTLNANPSIWVRVYG